MASTAKMGQDMPPAGGYGSIPWERQKLKTVFGWKLTFGMWAFSTTIGGIAYYFNRKKIIAEEIELRSARFAILPMLIAARDRAFLKQCRINRDFERRLMKDVPEWEVGTYFREPVYITEPNKFHEPGLYEFMIAQSDNDLMERIFRRHFT